MLDAYAQYLVSGLTMGSTYALTALGFTIIFNATGIINFAQGEFVMLGGMLSVAYHVSGLPLALAVVLAVATVTLVGGLMELSTIRPASKSGHGGVIERIIITIGVSIFVRGLAMLVFGKDTSALPPFSGSEPIAFLGATLMPQNLWVLALFLAVVGGMKLAFAKTLFGKAMLACATDATAAGLCGISVSRMVLASFMLAALVGALGGAVLAPLTMTAYDVGVMLGLKGFAACILGGLGNPFGAAAGGLILGVLESFGAGLISSAYKDAFAFVILLGLLFVRPTGLFGAASGERV